MYHQLYLFLHSFVYFTKFSLPSWKDGAKYYVYHLQCWVKDGSALNKSELVLRKVKFVQYKINSFSPCVVTLVRIEL